jgi:hypothetical protein
MANSNFVVHNGLTVGPLTINAATGDITTSGNLTLSGGGSISVSNVAVSAISQNDTSLSIVDTGSGSTVSIIIDGTTEQTIDADGVSLTTGGRYAINAVSVLSATTLGSSVLASSLTSVGNLTALSVAGATSHIGIVYANATTTSTSTSTGALVVPGTGGVGVGGNIYVGSAVYMAGAIAATLADATSLAIALG